MHVHECVLVPVCAIHTHTITNFLKHLKIINYFLGQYISYVDYTWWWSLEFYLLFPQGNSLTIPGEKGVTLMWWMITILWNCFGDHTFVSDGWHTQLQKSLIQAECYNGCHLSVLLTVGAGIFTKIIIWGPLSSDIYF